MMLCKAPRLEIVLKIEPRSCKYREVASTEFRHKHLLHNEILLESPLKYIVLRVNLKLHCEKGAGLLKISDPFL